MPTTPLLTQQLDKLEDGLPAIPARFVRLQRTLAGAAFERTACVVSAVADSTKHFLGTARSSGQTVADEATAQGARVSKAAAAKTTALLDSVIDAGDDQPGSGTPYEQWTKAQLLERATELGIEGRYGLDKAGLIAALRAV